MSVSLEAFNVQEDLNFDEHDECVEESTFCDGDIDIKRPRTTDTKDNRAAKPAKKLEKEMSKKNHSVIVITPQLMRQIDETLHPPEGLLAGGLGHTFKDNNNTLMSNSIIEANIRFNTSTFAYTSLRQTVHSKKLTKAHHALWLQDASSTRMPDDSAIASMLASLEITSDVPSGSRERRMLVAKLKESIQNDLVIIDNEARDVMKRMAGYWRFANRRTYNHMIRNNELWDWSTGQKLELIEEEEAEKTEAANTKEYDKAVTNKGLESSLELESYDEDLDVHKSDVEFNLIACGHKDEDMTFPKVYGGVKDTRHLRTQEEPYKLSVETTSPNVTSPTTPKRKFSVIDAFNDGLSEAAPTQRLEANSEHARKFGFEEFGEIELKATPQKEISPSTAEKNQVYAEVLHEEALALRNLSTATSQGTHEADINSSLAPQHQGVHLHSRETFLAQETQPVQSTAPSRHRSVPDKRKGEAEQDQLDSKSDSDSDTLFNPGALSNNPYALLAPPALPATPMGKQKRSLRIRMAGTASPSSMTARGGDFTLVSGKGKKRGKRG